MAKKVNIKEIEDAYKAHKNLSEANVKLLEEEMNSLNRIFNFRRRLELQDEIRNEKQEAYNKMNEAYNMAIEEGLTMSKSTSDAFAKRLKIQKDSLNLSNKNLNIQKRQLNTIRSISNIFKRDLNNIQFFKYLMESDKAIKQTNLELGLTGVRAEIVRDNFEDAAGFAARLGSNLNDLKNIQLTFADETGRAKMLTGKMLEDIVAIGQGTGLGVEQAARLAGQFELMGYNARATMDYVQGVVDTSERMGVNTTKVLKKINDNFKTLQKYTFRDGVKGFAEMAMYAEKFKIDMGSMLDSAERARTLEGAIDLAAQLQVMGGEFAKTDPFQMLFLSRNDPEKYTQKINEMTKGIATFRKNSEGVFETFISPMDIDRLEKVGQTLGMQRGELTQQARRMAEIQRLRQQMLSEGISRDDMKVIEGANWFMEKSGKFSIQIGNEAKAISQITKDHVEMLKTESVALNERAKASQDFETAYQNTIAEFKTVLLPILRGVNSVFEFIRPKITKFMDGKPEWVSEFTKSIGGFIGATFVLNKALGAFSSIPGFFFDKGFGGGRRGGKQVTKTLSGTGSQLLGQGKGAAAKSMGRGKGTLMGGLGVGAAALGTGAGIAVAAKGISSLADSLNKLDPEKVESFKNVAKTIAFVVPLSAGIGVLAAVAGASAGPLLAFGGAVALIGGGIGLAAMGVGKMAEGFANLLEVAPQASGSLKEIASGILAIQGAMSLGGVSAIFGGGIGFAQLNKTIGSMTDNSDKLKIVGEAFGNISTVLTGSKEDFAQIEKTIKSISNAEIGDMSVLTELKNLFKNPLKVEFADKEVGFSANIDLNIDGNKLFTKTNFARKVELRQLEYYRGKGAPSST